MGEDDPLERLARRGSERQTRQAARATREAARERARAEAASRALATESLDRWARLRRLCVAVLCIGAVAAVAATRGKPSAPGYFAIVGGTLLALFVGLFVSEKAARVFAAWELHKLARLPFRFDTEEYRNALGGKRAVCSPSLTVVFAAPVAVADRALIANAITGAAARTQSTWSGDELGIESDPLDTVFRPVRTRGGATKAFHSNHRVHAWVRAVVTGALVPIHRRAPIESIALRLR